VTVVGGSETTGVDVFLGPGNPVEWELPDESFLGRFVQEN
jgi:hypothetical protein